MMTKNMKSLIEDASADGFRITSYNGYTMIMKRVGRWKKIRGLVIYADGTAFDVSVDLSVAKGIRAYKVMRQILGI